MDFNGNDNNNSNNEFTQYNQADMNGNNNQVPTYDNVYGTPQPQQQGVGGLAIASLVLGIIGIVTCCFGVGALFGLVSLIMGIVSLVQGRGKAMAIVGIVLGSIGLLLGGYMIFAWITSIAYYGGWDGFWEAVMEQAAIQQGM